MRCNAVRGEQPHPPWLYCLPVPQAFLKYAIDAQCPLTFPFPGDDIVLLRTGLLRHVDR